MSDAKTGEAILKPGTLKEYAADFGALMVPENRGKKDSRLIRLPVLRLRSRREHPAEPVFTLEGGPGGTNIKPDYVRDWLLENHDVVMVGYRGVDGSISLKCPEINTLLKTVEDPLSQAGLKELGAVMGRAAKRLQDEGIDLPEYDIINVVDDMEAARKALGYPSINLTGASYGGAVAYTYCIRYPQSIHRNLMANQALDAYAAAEHGDYSGLAFMAVYWGQVGDYFNWGDLLGKTYCTQTVRTRDYETEMDPPNGIIGSPLSKLGWGALKYGVWPCKPLPPAYQAPQETNVQTLLVRAIGGDETEPSEKYARYFRRGQVVFLKDLGHMDVGSLEPQAAHRLEKRFFLEGIADASLYQSVANQPRDFTPRPSFQELARQMLSPK